MSNEKEAFGALLRRLIKEAGLKQTEFIPMLDIGRQYFYDILRGNPPPPYLQKHFMDLLQPSPENVRAFYDLAGALRKELPADIQLAVVADPGLIPLFRALIEHTEQEKHHE